MNFQKILGFQPKLIPTILTIPALIVLFSLGIWQLYRLEWKTDLINEIRQRSQIPEIELPTKIDLANMLYRKVILKGEFLHNQEMHMYGGSLKFKGEVGYYIFTPMRLVDNRLIIVNRGWVSEKAKEASNRPNSLIQGMNEVEGIIMQSEAKPRFVHDNDPSHNLWLYVDLQEMKAFLKEPIEDFYILAKDDPNSNLRGRNLEPNLRNHHLGYALTWFALAIALLMIYIIYHRQK